MLKSLFAASLLITGSSALAQAQPQAPQQQPQPPADQTKVQNRVICRDVGDIGSRLESHRICMTADQWKQQEQDSQDITANSQHLGPH